MAELVVPDLQRGYVDVCQYVLDRGAETSPRGMLTKEVEGALIVINDPTRVLPVKTGRGLNLGLAALEATNLVGGFVDPELTRQVAPNTTQFMDGGTFLGAYGQRLRNQLPFLVQALQRDPDTRQAILNIWDPQQDLMFSEQPRDIPCTIALRFSVRGGALNMHVHMRSNDVWWGLAYDAFVFAQLQCTLAAYLGLRIGVYRHFADSLHAYQRDWDSIEQLRYPPGVHEARPFTSRGFTVVPDQPFTRTMARVRSLVYDYLPEPDRVGTDDWFIREIAKARGRRA